MRALKANFIFPSFLTAAMFPAVAYAMEIKTPTVSMPHIIVPHVTTPSVSTHIITPQVKLHVITPEGATGSKITNTNSDNITIKDSHTNLHSETNVLQQKSPATLGGATGKIDTDAPITQVGAPALDGSSKGAATFSLNKIDPTGKASVVSLTNTSAEAPVAAGGDVETMALSVLAKATGSQDDLKAIMDGVQLMTKSKQFLRQGMNIADHDVANAPSTVVRGSIFPP